MGEKTSKEKSSKQKLSHPLPGGHENSRYLTNGRQKGGMFNFKESLCQYNSKDVVISLEVKQKMSDFDHNPKICIIKLGCTFAESCKKLSSLVNYSKCFPFTKSDKKMLEKTREPSFVFI